jgi:hypothetical protein
MLGSSLSWPKLKCSNRTLYMYDEKGIPKESLNFTMLVFVS